MELARRREASLLERLGETVRDSEARCGEREVQDVLAEAAGLAGRVRDLRRAACASLEQDRSDYPAASPWAKPAVILRGLLTRLVLYDQVRRGCTRLRPVHRALGAAWLDGRLRPPGGAERRDLATLVATIAAHRQDLQAATAARSLALEPFGGRAVPAWAHAVASEGRAVLLAFAKEMRAAFVPRLPGLAGLGAGWWVAHAFTASRWDRFLAGFGLRRGGPKVVSAETYERLQFWAPLLAAAVCAYLCSRLSASLQKRYSPQAVADGRSPPPA
jgi:hypothetical protein